MIKLYNNDTEEYIEVVFFTFPDGSRHVKGLTKDADIKHLFVEAKVSSSDDIMDILLLKEAIDYIYPLAKVYLHMPYVLGSRQDRRMVEGEPLSVKVYTKLINSANFDEVFILDPHSSVTSALLDNVTELDVGLFYESIALDSDNAVVISPYAGAVKRATYFAKCKSINTLIKADKTRNLDTGEITAFELYANNEDIEGKDIYLVDDICTNGGTFLGLLEVIDSYNPAFVSLVVTHADHNHGIAKMANIFDHVYLTNSKGEFSFVKDLKDVTVVDIFT